MTLEMTREPARTATSARRTAGLLERTARQAVHGRLRTLRHGRLRIIDAHGSLEFGPDDADLTAVVTVRNPAFWTAVALRGSVGAGESYMNGDWTSDDLTTLVRILVRDRATLEGVERGLARFAVPALKLFHAFRRNTRTGSARNIAAHYDLGNDFYALWLDPSLMYSCAYFERDGATLDEAQFAKNDRLCRLLRLAPGDHLLEIGTGWGGFAIHAARNFGCRVTTTTISRAQHELATRRVAKAGLADRIEVLLCDYRELEGRFDKLVSIEMIEAVGHEFYGAFFSACDRLLAEGGLMALQTITIRDELYERARTSVDFIQRHVFPGSSIPSIAALRAAAARSGRLAIHSTTDIGPHYATTLRMWRARFEARLPQVRALGFDDRFIRMWRFYLAYCEGGFAERQIGDAQMLLARR